MFNFDLFYLIKGTYTLYAVIIHSGSSSDFGHYFTYAKDE